MFIFSVLSLLVRCLILPRMALAAEILALRQQLVVLNRTARRPQLRQRDRLFWVVLSKLWNGWRGALVIVKPDTVGEPSGKKLDESHLNHFRHAGVTRSHKALYCVCH